MNPSYIDYELSLEKDKIVIVIPLCTTDATKCVFYELIIDENGDFEYILMDNNNNYH